MQVPDAGTNGQPWPQPLLSYFDWARAQQAAGRLEFSIKDGEVPAVPAVWAAVAPPLSQEALVEEC